MKTQIGNELIYISLKLSKGVPNFFLFCKITDTDDIKHRPQFLGNTV